VQRTFHSAAAILAMVFGFCGTASVQADSFCVENKVYDSDELLSTSLTVFHNGVAYDLLEKPRESIVFDPPRGRLVLLDHQRKHKVELQTVQVETFVEALKQQATQTNSSVLKFLVNPVFNQRVDDKSGDLLLESRWMSYRLKTIESPNATAAAQYADYVRWQALLNAMIAPGATPAFPRLVVQDTLAERKELATRVERTVYGAIPGRAVNVIRAEHRYQWRLLESDLKRIEQVNKDLAEYTTITLEEYQRSQDPTPPADGQ
jgi:hypothetical protein